VVRNKGSFSLHVREGNAMRVKQ